jgi:hypothetical protein
MKPKSSIGTVLFFLLIPHIAFSADFFIDPPPRSMDKLYLEKGKTSEWIEQMRKINKAFGAAFISLGKKNWEEALKNSRDFGSAYQKAANMVPEWKDLFDLEASEFFIASIQSRDSKKIKQLSIKVKKTCTQCHRKHKISVWARYHWPSTQTIKIFDPIDEDEVDYNLFMNRLSTSLNNIEIFFDQGSLNESWKAIEIFSKRLRGLRSVCMKCHVTAGKTNTTTIKNFFVGNDMIDALQEIKKSYASGIPDAKLFQKKFEYISNRSCKMCHLIHQPAEIIQNSWKN